MSRYTYRPRHAAPRPAYAALIMFLAVAAVLLGVGISAGMGNGSQTIVAPAATWEADTCESVDATTLTEDEAGALIAEGWRGDPTDGRDALYVPGCLPF